MVILDGKKIQKEIFFELKEKVNTLSVKPNLAIIQVGNNEASNVYIKQKEKMAEFIGYGFKYFKYDENITELELLNKISELNNDDNIHGILVQMPLPKHIDVYKIQNAIKSVKDVDGLSDLNTGRLAHNMDGLYSCTPYGVMELFNRYNISLEGRHAVIVGRSNLVGKPMMMMLINAGCTVTVCHSRTIDLAKYTRDADILVVAVGKPNIITADMVKDGAIAIDVGITRGENGLCGDIDFDNVCNKCSYITPVPGGVGPMTVAMLATNLLKAYTMQVGNND